MTRACDEGCFACPVQASPLRFHRELDLNEAHRLIEQIHAMGIRRLVLTGGDPLKRPDIFELIRFSRDLGLETALFTLATRLLTREAIGHLHEAGLSSIVLAIDGSCSASHDALRGVAGSYRRTIAAARACRRLGVVVEMRTHVAGGNVGELPAISRIVEGEGAALWSLAFRVDSGPTEATRQISPEEFETALRWLHAYSLTAPCAVDTIEAPQFRRVSHEESRRDPHSGRPEGPRERSFFVSHTGEVSPSPVFPAIAGSTRTQRLAEIFDASDVFRRLGEPDRLRGRCGTCPYRNLCGGSRARAFAASADPLAEDPLCTYIPPGPEI
ncbi:MAG TPA: radical SAM protein [Candidatus Saccharimonadales bacterium]|nr:radical SAM protein [Candidatus Saccharimonadales bacterium]